MQRSPLGAVFISVALLALSTATAERINHEGRILGPAPVVTAPTLFNTPQAVAIVGAMQIMPIDNPWKRRHLAPAASRQFRRDDRAHQS